MYWGKLPKDILIFSSDLNVLTLGIVKTIHLNFLDLEQHMIFSTQMQVTFQFNTLVETLIRGTVSNWSKNEV